MPLFNNILSWWSDLLVEETVVPIENHRPAASQHLIRKYPILTLVFLG